MDEESYVVLPLVLCASGTSGGRGGAPLPPVEGLDTNLNSPGCRRKINFCKYDRLPHGICPIANRIRSYTKVVNDLFPSNEDDEESCLSKVDINFGLVNAAVRDPSCKAASGTDGIVPAMHKYGGTSLVEHLVVIFQDSLDNGSVPD